MRSAVVLMQAGAHMVILEGGGWTTETARFLGLTPQTVHALGGYRAQEKSDEAAAFLRRETTALQDG